ncbi:MAG: hypothetical protein COX57_09340 [Alphaproteobacteria bacterium CG_4_10_14_0_2_um_filter_63_37]|nr:MAG: hypothetical protein AUJ55_02325 [Proteobacteria bacterium CG1_02_64_396]PJA24266.1 MAG: hypothetical protein COX57_09340 [Alphaproteobacteria bacterium CG_4_10_14_0_2_um_filter_63_37]
MIGKPSWAQFDFEGGGLQAAQLAYRRRSRKPWVARLWWLLLFPLMAHRVYLQGVRGWPWVLGMLALVVVSGFVSPYVLVLPVAFQVADVFKLDAMLSEANRRIRQEVFLRSDVAPAPHFDDPALNP